LSDTDSDFIFFTDEKVFHVASRVNMQNDRVYVPRNAKKRDIAAERLLRCRPTFYRAMHFSAKRGIAIACRLSVRLSVCNVGEL